METEFRAIVHSEYGAPEQILRIGKCYLRSEELGSDDVLLKVITPPIHHGDIQILSALPQGGPVAPIREGSERIPGFEGVGTIVWFGVNAKAHVLRFSQRRGPGENTSSSDSPGPGFRWTMHWKHLIWKMF
jgi:hypothetical protein